MSTFEEERTQDGHTILLMETQQDSRTFSDYPNTYTCLETIVNMYEEENEATQRQGGRDLDDFMRWIDSFYQIKLLVFDKEISRYRMTEREGLKKLFEENPENDSYRPTNNGNSLPIGALTNGITTNGIENHLGNDDSDDDDEDNWDE